MMPRAPSLIAVTLALGLIAACSGDETIHQVVTITGVKAPRGAPNAGTSATGGLDTGAGAMGGSLSGAAASGGSAGSANAGTNADAGAGNVASSGGSTSVGGDTTAAGAGATSSAGNASGGDGGSSQSGGNAGAAGAGNSGGEPSGLACTSDLDCGIIDGVFCKRSACQDGQCSAVVDQNAVPIPSNACLLGTCNKYGEAGTEPGPAGKPCSGQNGEKLCDSFGRCVQCLQTGDCADGKVCNASRLCVTAACSDVDCGGICPPCDDGKKCNIDADCASNACDDASHTCVANQCHDQRQNGDETDADCGGGTCPKCDLGKSCILSSDCKGDACDFFKLQCVSWQCGDRRKDGAETDVDCGGPTCNSCFPGEACNNSIDCQGGHQCVNGVCK